MNDDTRLMKFKYVKSGMVIRCDKGVLLILSKSAHGKVRKAKVYDLELEQIDEEEIKASEQVEVFDDEERDYIIQKMRSRVLDFLEHHQHELEMLELVQDMHKAYEDHVPTSLIT